MSATLENTSIADLGSSQECALTIFCLGFRRSIFNTSSVLEVLDVCQSRIDKLCAFLPAHSSVLAGFNLTSQVRSELLHLSEAGDRPVLIDRSKRSALFLNRVATHYFREETSGVLRRRNSEYESQREVSPREIDSLAIMWVLMAIGHYYQTLPSQFYLDLNVWFKSAYPSSDSHRVQISEMGYATTSIIASADELDIWLTQICGLTPESPAEGKNSPQVERLSRLLKTAKSLAGDVSVEVIGHVPTDNPVVSLSERDLLTSSWFFPTPSEQQKIKSFLFSEIEKKTNSGRHYEALILALSIWMGKEIDLTLEQLCVGIDEKLSPDEEYLVLKRSTPTELIPCREIPYQIRDQQKRAVVSPPKYIQQALFQFLPYKGQARLIDLLPPTAKPWAARCYESFAKVLGCGEQRAKLICRDYMIRLLYEGTGDSALVQVWRDSSKLRTRSFNRVALLNYVIPTNFQLQETYKDACKKIFNSFASATAYFEQPRNQHLRFSEISPPSAFANAISSLKSEYLAASDVVSSHNAIALSTAATLIVATGHRKSKTPFFFPWDVDLHAGIAFISDKQVVGSEARFVPLPSSACINIKNYVAHLYRLSKSPGVNQAVRNHAAWICEFFDIRDLNKRSKVVSSSPDLGFLFQIFPERSTGESISTFIVEEAFKQKKVDFSTREFRAQLAQFVSDGGAGGREVQALLGHQPELHAFGPQSSLSVLDWAIPIRKLQEKYLAELGISEPEVMPQVAPEIFDPPDQIFNRPLLQMSAHSYEGRGRDSRWASQRARQAIRRVVGSLDEEKFSGTITETEISAVKALVLNELQGDPAASKKVFLQLAIWFEKLGKSGSVKVDSAYVNLAATEAGPVDINFARFLRISKSFRNDWLGRIGEPIGVPVWDALETLAQLCINLVVSDAIVSPEKNVALIEGLLDGDGVALYEDLVTLRGVVTTPKAIFDTSVLPSYYSAAMILGFLKLPPKEVETLFAEDVEARVSEILKKMLGQPAVGNSWRLHQLCAIFRPFWFIRLPGYLYSIAIGAHQGPAADRKSEANLFATSALQTSAFEVGSSISRLPYHVQAQTPQKLAYEELVEVLKKSRGVFGDAGGTNRNQRAAMRSFLEQQDGNALSYWKQEQPVVDQLHGFLKHLLSEGGRRKQVLAFNTISHYFNTLAKYLIEIAWDTNFEQKTLQEYTAIYQELKDKLTPTAQKDTAIRTLHRYLQDTIGAPHCPAAGVARGIPSRVRGAVFTQKQVQNAVTVLVAIKEPKLQSAIKAAQIISALNGYGLRAKECLGIETNNFDPSSPTYLSISANRLRDLKSPASRRTIPHEINPAALAKILVQTKKRAELAPLNRYFLFEEPGAESPISQNTAAFGLIYKSLRWASGNSTAVAHSLRHTYATRLTLNVCSHDAELPGVKRAIERLCSAKENGGDAMLRHPHQWPFRVDAAAVILGHSDCNTLLDVYFHGSAWLTAEHCQKLAIPTEISDARLANILGIDRSVVSKERKSLTVDAGAVDNKVTQLLISKRIKGAFTRSSPHKGSSRKNSTDDKSMLDGFLGSQIHPVMLDRLLRKRILQGWTLEELVEHGTVEMGLSKRELDAFVRGYKVAVTDIGFTDYEGTNSELVRGGQKYLQGMLRSVAERERFIGFMAKEAAANGQFKESLVGFLDQWYLRVDPDNPMIVCKSQEEIKNSLQVLNRLCVPNDQLKLSAYSSVDDPAVPKILESFPKMRMFTEGRASRGVKNSIVKEYAIDIEQTKDAFAPDGRDFQRCLLIAFLSIKRLK